MLVEEGDLLKLGVARYEPFVEDPPILSVRKQELPSAGPRAGEVEEPRSERPTTGIIPRSAEEPDPRGEGAPETGPAPDEREPPVEPYGEEGETHEVPPVQPEPPAGPPPGEPSPSGTGASRP